MNTVDWEPGKGIIYFLIAKLASNVSTSRSLSSSNTYLLLVPTVAPSNIEQSKRQVVGNLVSPNDKNSHHFFGLLDEEEDKQNVLKRKVPEGFRPNIPRQTTGISRAKPVPIQPTSSQHNKNTTGTSIRGESPEHLSQPTASSADNILMLAENLSQLVSCTDQQRNYTSINKQQNTHESTQQRIIPLAPPISHQHQNDSKSNQDMVGWVKMDEQALVKDFDANLSGLGLELGAGAYNMSEVLNLPIFKQEDSIVTPNSSQNLPPLQYMLQAPTSPASKVHEETLTYLNQGQPYEIRLKKLRDLPNFGSNKLAKSFLRVVFHDRRLQYTEHQQLEGWRYSRPGDRLLNIDLPMSVGIMHPNQPPNLLNMVEFVWSLEKQASVYVQVHCISTEFTPKKHGGERGVPFRIQIDTYISDLNGDMGDHIHSASCQIKVFKPKGADRKQKTDKDKMEKRSAQDKLKYQPSYDSTLLTECSPMPINLYEDSFSVINDEQKRQSYTETSIDTVVDVDLTTGDNGYLMEDASPSTSTGSRASINSNYNRLMEAVNQQHTQVPPCLKPKTPDILQPFASPPQTMQWLQRNRFSTLTKTFNSFCGGDMLSLTRDDLIQICGSAEGIRLYNAVRAKKVQPRLTLYMTPSTTPESEGEIKVYRAFYLEQLTAAELMKEASSLFEQQNGGGRPHITRALYQPAKSNVHVLVTDELVGTLRDEQCFTVLVIKNEGSDGFQIILKQ